MPLQASAVLFENDRQSMTLDLSIAPILRGFHRAYIGDAWYLNEQGGGFIATIQSTFNLWIGTNYLQITPYMSLRKMASSNGETLKESYDEGESEPATIEWKIPRMKYRTYGLNLSVAN